MTSHYTNQYKKLFISFSCLVMISACSSSDTTPGTKIHAHLTHLPTANTVTDGPTGGKQFDNGQGVTIELTSAYLTISEMDLRTDCSASPFAHLFDTLYEMVIPTAHAHTESTPTKIGSPLVVNVLNPDTEELEFGHFSPPPASYCGITVHMHPADADTRGLPTTFPMDGLVLRIEGNYDAGGGPAIFTYETPLELEHADIAFPAAIELSISNLTDEAHLNIEYHTWFNGFDGTAMDDLANGVQTAIDQLRENVVNSIVHD